MSGSLCGLPASFNYKMVLQNDSSWIADSRSWNKASNDKLQLIMQIMLNILLIKQFL